MDILGKISIHESKSKSNSQSTFVINMAENYSLGLYKFVMDLEILDVETETFSYIVSSNYTGVNSGDTETTYSISENNKQHGIIDTSVTSMFSDGRMKLVSYKGDRIQSIIRYKDSKLHGLQEYHTKTMATVMGARTCYDNGIKIISENCESF